MSRLIRYPLGGNTIFITTVTADRNRILVQYCPLLREAIEKAKAKLHFHELAWVIVPDHYHAVIQYGTGDISLIMQTIKMSFSSNYRKIQGIKNGRVWQRRFWDHIIRNQIDLNHHINYIHYNPVKHGLSVDPMDYEYSSFGKYLDEGFYERGWSVSDKIDFDGDFGE